MANNLSKNIKNGLLSSYYLNVIPSNTPAFAQNRYNKYHDETNAFYDTYAKYASNVFDAEMQGLNYADFYAWRKVRIRSSAVINPSTGENLSDNWQKILILDKTVDMIPLGAYVKFGGSTWIAYNPDNIAAAAGTAIVVRCNTTYNTLDYYGNIVKTPMHYAKGTILASSPYYMQYDATIDGYQHIVMQYNENTKHVGNNTRIILGNSAFGFYGVSNFALEFTDDETSNHVIRADLRLQETLKTDDTVNHIADAGSFSFNLNLGGANTMHEGDTQKLTVQAQRNGEFIESTEEYPLSYTWASSDENVATVDENGVVTAVSDGNCVISCVLDQNTQETAEFSIVIEARESNNYVDFVSSAPENVRVLDSFSLEAKYFENGVATDNAITYTVEAENEDSLSFTQSSNILYVQTWASSETPVTITASYDGYSESVSFTILGY